MILKTYTRLLATDLDATLPTLRPLHRGDVHYRFTFGWELVCIGDILVVAGTSESLAPIAGSFGPWVVDDLDATLAQLTAAGAEIVRPIAASETGRFLYARHSDGSVVEYVQWKPELVERLVEALRRAGIPSSQI